MVGIGPGHPLDRTRRAERALAAADTVVGYGPYLDAIADLTAGKELVRGGMGREVERCREAVERAVAGHRVALVSSGDPGIYGMAGLALELAQARGAELPIEVIPGVTAASAAAAALGAPLMVDFAVISLSDLLVSWEEIRARLEAVARAGLVTVLYNPKSRSRTGPFAEAAAIFVRERPGDTPVGLVENASLAEQRVTLTDVAHLAGAEVGMKTVVVVGNGRTRVLGPWLVTLRGYDTARTKA